VTVADRVLQLLRVSHAAYDDDELARRLDVEPWQASNQACRRLAAEGGSAATLARMARS